MDFSTLFRTKENLNLDKSTLTILRYIAIIGQFIAINIVFFYLNLEITIKASLIVIFIGLLTNFYLQFKVKANQLKDDPARQGLFFAAIDKIFGDRSPFASKQVQLADAVKEASLVRKQQEESFLAFDNAFKEKYRLVFFGTINN